MSSSQSLVVLLDGTWNTVEDNTNIWRIHNLVATTRSDGAPQRVYYDKGVGTALGARLIGGAFGYGLSENVQQAYEWLRSVQGENDDIYIFGFSRGAFTARSLAGMISRFGMLRRDATLTMETLFSRYRRMRDDKSIRRLQQLHYDREHGQGAPFTEEDEALYAQSRRIKIRFVGVFDTVGTLGIPFGDIPGISRKQSQFHDTRLSTAVRTSRQALAIDEHRTAFAPTLWKRFSPVPPAPPRDKPDVPPDVEQRWFVGAHANVGGGYQHDTLPDLPLAWMLGEASAAGLALKAQFVPSKPAKPAPVNDSFSEFAWGLYKLVKLGRRFTRAIHEPTFPVKGGVLDPMHETIDGSVFERWRSDPSYRPAAILEWAARRGVDPLAVLGTIEA